MKPSNNGREDYSSLPVTDFTAGVKPNTSQRNFMYIVYISILKAVGPEG